MQPKYRFRVARFPGPGFQSCKRLVRERMVAQYEGWSDAFDDQFDSRSWFAYLTSLDEEQPLAVMKLVERAGERSEGPLVCELADRDPLRARDVDLECGGFAFTDAAAARLMGPASSYANLGWGLGDIVSSVDARNRLLRRVFTKSWEVEELGGPPFVFDGFCHRIDGRTVEWVPILDRASTRRERLERLYPDIESSVVFDGVVAPSHREAIS